MQSLKNSSVGCWIFGVFLALSLDIPIFLSIYGNPDVGPIIATLAYTKHHTAPFAIAGAVTFVAVIWSISLRSTATRGIVAPDEA